MGSAQTLLVAEIDAFIAGRGMAETTFGRLAVNDGKFVGRVRAGGNITLATVDRVRAYIKDHAKPVGAPAEATA